MLVLSIQYIFFEKQINKIKISIALGGEMALHLLINVFRLTPRELNSWLIMKQRRPRPSFTTAFTLRFKKPHHTKLQIGFFWMDHKETRHIWSFCCELEPLIYLVRISNHLLLPPTHYPHELKPKPRIKLFFFYGNS